MQQYNSGLSAIKQYQADRPLTDTELRTYAPSIFAETAHVSRSTQYAHLPTIAVVDALRTEGFQPFFVAQSGSRGAHRRSHTKHMLRFRHESKLAQTEVNEIILVNSHDGTSSYQMTAGCFRFVCANGLMIGNTVAEQRIRHQGAETDSALVIEGAYEILEQFDVVDESREQMQATTLTQDEQVVLGQAALTLRYPEGNYQPSPQDINISRRVEDRKTDLWTTFNRIQENVLRGGLPNTVNPPASGRRSRSRPVTSIQETSRVNKALWDLADNMRMLKQGIDINDFI